MQVRVSGKQVEIGGALPDQVRSRLTAAIEKHFDRGSRASVVFSRERTGFHADCNVHLDSGAILQAEGNGEDAYRAFDDLLAHVEAQARRYKRKLRNHHDKQGAAKRSL
jgi:ribosomal subunit interface protein